MVLQSNDKDRGQNSYGLDGQGINPGGVRFCARFQTGPGSHPASHAMGTVFYSRCKKAGTNRPHTSSADAM